MIINNKIYREDTEAPLPHDKVKYLVFLSHLLSLFTQCRLYHQHCNGDVVQQMGTLIASDKSVINVVTFGNGIVSHL